MVIALAVNMSDALITKIVNEAEYAIVAGSPALAATAIKSITAILDSKFALDFTVEDTFFGLLSNLRMVG